jgi:nucleoside-diphosphate-sugar epimerase
MDLSHPITVAVTGASGFVGNALIAALIESDIYRVNALRHSAHISRGMVSCVQDTWGNLLQADTLKDWPPPESTLVHLAYMWGVTAESNYKATNNLLDACHRAGIKRLIHVSTAAVVGRADRSSINEETPCCPVTAYGKTKMQIEEMIRESAARNNFDLVILRPTSVYGRGGTPLVKLCRDLRHSPWPMNYLKACLFGRRAMNLVHLDNVIAAIRFFIDYPSSLSGSTFIISDDHDAANNFINVEGIARELLGVNDYPVPEIPLPGSFLSLILRLRSRNIIDPYCRFSSDRLFSLGFHPPVSLEDGLRDYFLWYRQSVLPQGSA